MMERSLAVRIKGIGASPGLAIGKAMIYGRKGPQVSRRFLSESEASEELARWKDALDKAMEETERLRSKVENEAGERAAEIFSAHLLMLSDPLLASEVERKIREGKVNAEFALIEVTQKLKSSFQSMEDPYLRLRAMDIQDLEDRLLSHLVGFYLFPPSPMDPTILVAHELRPSEVVQLDRKKIIGLALEAGSRTSHSIILARSMNVPAVVGLSDVSKRIEEDELIILDGNQGELILEPGPELIVEYEKRQEREELSLLELEAVRALPAITRDGKRIRLLGNVTRIEEVTAVLEASAEGIGLLRSEFLFLDRRTSPREEEQFEAYRRIAEITGDRPAVIRTFDIGGDNPLLSIPQRREENPFLGTRSLRLCLEHPDIFRTQLRAILRAAIWGNLKIILPMVATIEDLQEGLELLREAEQDLREEGLPFKEGIEVGVMLEVPSAALTLDLLMPEVDFFSIGTNDLFQYALAIDRTNERLASRYGPLDPAILRLVKGVVEAAGSAGKPLSVCGELAGEILALPLLVGLGVEELSMSVSALLPAKRVIRQIAASEARELAEVCLRERTARGIERLSAEFLRKLL
jgi:phosphoenolpyruvate-protein phosphotransferase (PTS system enzyme I)